MSTVGYVEWCVLHIPICIPSCPALSQIRVYAVWCNQNRWAFLVVLPSSTIAVGCIGLSTSLISLGDCLLNRFATSNSNQDAIASKTWLLSRSCLRYFDKDHTFEDWPFWPNEVVARATVPLGRMHHKNSHYQEMQKKKKKMILQLKWFIVVFFIFIFFIIVLI